MRKAGGTTIGSLIKSNLDELNARAHRDNAQLSPQQNNIRERFEAYHYFHTQNALNITDKLLTQPQKVYAIVFRNPIQRIISQYYFEFRWGCQECDQFGTPNIKSALAQG